MSGRTSLLVVLGLLAGACSPSTQPASGGASGASTDSATVRTAIEAANARFLDAFKRGDKAGLVANYTEDAILMMANEEAWRGRGGIEKGFAGLLSQVSFKDGATKTEDVMLAGDLAAETGTFWWTLQPKAGAEIKDKGKYLTVWKRQPDGSWKIVRDINNSDLPAK